MKKIFLWSISLTLLTLALSTTVIFFGTRSNVTAQSASNIAMPKIEEEKLNPNAEQQKLDLANEVLLRAESETNQLKKAGWVHVVMNQTMNSDTTNMAPDGSIAPNNFVTEDWVLLDENGNQTQGIFLQLNMDYKIVQVSILKNGNWHNLTYGDVISAPENLPYTFDFGFPEIAAKLKNNLTKDQVEVNGELFDKFSAEEKYTESINVLGLNKKVTALSTEAFFNTDGMIKIYQTIFTFEDGSSQISSYVEVQLFEQGIEPPAEIIAYLEQEGIK